MFMVVTTRCTRKIFLSAVCFFSFVCKKPKGMDAKQKIRGKNGHLVHVKPIFRKWENEGESIPFCYFFFSRLHQRSAVCREVLFLAFLYCWKVTEKGCCTYMRSVIVFLPPNVSHSHMPTHSSHITTFHHFLFIFPYMLTITRKQIFDLMFVASVTVNTNSNLYK